MMFTKCYNYLCNKKTAALTPAHKTYGPFIYLQLALIALYTHSHGLFSVHLHWYIKMLMTTSLTTSHIDPGTSGLWPIRNWNLCFSWSSKNLWHCLWLILHRTSVCPFNKSPSLYSLHRFYPVHHQRWCLCGRHVLFPKAVLV